MTDIPGRHDPASGMFVESQAQESHCLRTGAEPAHRCAARQAGDTNTSVAAVRSILFTPERGRAPFCAAVR
jgi:hypothetical protein